MARYPQSKSIVIREIYEDTYETILDYMLRTENLKAAFDEVRTIWRKGSSLPAAAVPLPAQEDTK
jgi:hypothetical protein